LGASEPVRSCIAAIAKNRGDGACASRNTFELFVAVGAKAANSGCQQFFVEAKGTGAESQSLELPTWWQFSDARVRESSEEQ
jgi:hypothetical protein